MWGRRATEVSAQTPVATSQFGPRALNTSDQLLRRADWEHLSDEERHALVGAFGRFPADAGTDSTTSAGADDATQDWVAALMASTLQAESAQLIRAWLDDAAPDAHVYIGGSPGQGRHSLVASLARQAMARRPAPPDYCYVPEPSALGRAYLLPLPSGTGEAFAKAIDQTLRMLTAAWKDVVGGESGDGDAAAQSQGTPRTSPQQLIAQAFSTLDVPDFASVRPYVERLRAAFATLAAAQADLPVTYDDLPTWPVHAATGDAPGAPVIAGTLIREKVDDLLMRANGGVLILSASDLLVVDGSWPALSIALASHALQVRAGWPLLPLTVRVALVGSGAAYNDLARAAGDFNRLFRCETWCKDSVIWNKASEAVYAALAQGVAQRQGLPDVDPSGVARLVEEGGRIGDGLNRGYLSTDLVWLRDLVIEAGSAARVRAAMATSGTDVVAILLRRRTLQGANARRVREAILSGQANTPTAGAAVGQVNGLGIYEFHPPEGSFAVPTRISATVSPGRDERVLDIEREADQADADHVRGEMTIEGYLAYRYGQTRPINLVARIRFEQEHGTTGGDSASGAILFALLSALAQVPIRYSYAVTGAVGQYGEMQPIGGVNTKIEGFWDLCRQRRALGEQAEGGYGVLIPTVNVRDLMLHDEIAQAIVQEGWFHVWPISTVDEALAILTGVPAADVHARVERQLQRFHELGVQSRGAR
jgi:hypothetical protein